MSESVLRVVSQVKVSSGSVAAPTPPPEGSQMRGCTIFAPVGGRHACKPAPSESVDVFVYVARPFQC